MATQNLTCSIEGCDRKREKRGWCSAHYKRWRRHGDPEVMKHFRDPEAAFSHRTEWLGDCLVWSGKTNPTGYGRMKVDGKYMMCHRYAWIRVNGPIDPEMEVDHTCHNRSCCNVKHLRLTTHKQNMENRSGPHSNNITGIRGVGLDRRSGKYRVRVNHNGVKHFGGEFDDPREAEKVAIALRNKLFTHNDLDRTA